MTRTWILLGATSIIAEQFAHLAAQNNCNLRLIGRDLEQLTLISQDLKIRYSISCDLRLCDFSQKIDPLNLFDAIEGEFDLFIAQSDFTDNLNLNTESITQSIHVNILASVLLINHYLNLKQKKHHILYLSSVAASRGRAKNSLYGGTKAALEIYLQGVQQGASETQHICIAKLGFIDTKQTYGLPGIFYAAPPSQCAKACWKAMQAHKRLLYFPKFWFLIMAVIRSLPFFIYKKMKI